VSFACSKAKHPLEKLICSDPQLSHADEALNQAYKARLAILFDKAAFRAQQQDWLKILRTRCAASCARADVAAEYAAQLAMIRKLNEESWTANYKSGDEADLTLQYAGAGFSFPSRAPGLDSPDPVFCGLPKKGELDPLVRDKAGSVTDIRVSSRGCAHACKPSYMHDDDYQPANNWACRQPISPIPLSARG